MTHSPGPDEQKAAPFLDALTGFRDRRIVSYSTPGHKQGAGAPAELLAAFGSQALELDVPHGGGADDTHRTSGVLRQAERLAAAAWGADDSRFLVNGSSTGNIAALLATCTPGDTVLVARNLHTSLLSGLILSGARPVYLHPDVDIERNILLDISVDTVRVALDQHLEAKAVMLVSPSYTGVASDLRAIARLCQERAVPLFVDEAWGPHFPFHPDLPPAAVQAGASAGVTSIHKMLSGLTQASLMTFGGSLLSKDRIEPAITLIETTSPSAMILASIDAARRQMALQGESLLERTLQLAGNARQAIGSIPGLSVVGNEIVGRRAGAGFDPTRIIVDVRNLGCTGFQAESFLRTSARVGVEMSDLTSVIVHLTIGDTRASLDHLLEGFRGLSASISTQSPARATVDLRSSGSVLLAGEQVLTPREAALGRTRAVPLTEAAGAISAEIITPYPPGIPLIAPGERFSAACIEYLQVGRQAGMYISGARDPKLETVQIVDG